MLAVVLLSSRPNFQFLLRIVPKLYTENRIAYLSRRFETPGKPLLNVIG
jgi:hypothetical protein